MGTGTLMTFCTSLGWGGCMGIVHGCACSSPLICVNVPPPANDVMKGHDNGLVLLWAGAVLQGSECHDFGAEVAGFANLHR